MANPEKAKRTNLIKRFGTDNIEEILGPDVLAGTRTLRDRMVKDWGFKSTCVAQWRDGYVPKEIWQRIGPLQKALAQEVANQTLKSKTPEQKAQMVERVKATSLKRYGVMNVMQCPEIQARCEDSLEAHYGARNVHDIPELEAKRRGSLIAKYGAPTAFADPTIRRNLINHFNAIYGGPTPFSDPAILHKAHETSLKRYGGNPASLPPAEILRRLAAYDLEPTIPIEYNSDKYPQIPVKCIYCGRPFLTRWTSNGYAHGINGMGLLVCGCQSNNKSQLEKLLRAELTRRGYSVDSLQPDWMPSRHGGQNLEIDLYFKDLNIGIELNGFKTHNSDSGPGDSPGKEFDYHAYKSDCAARNGVDLYHYWYTRTTPNEFEAALTYILGVLDGQVNDIDVHPGDTLSRDNYPDPSIFGLPYTDLGPQPFTDPDGNTCYTSGLWLFHSPDINKP